MIDYYLHVDLIVPTNEEQEFERLMGTFMANGAFASVDPTFADYRLVFALKSEDAFEYAVAGRFGPKQVDEKTYSATANAHRASQFSSKQEVRRYVHLWEIPDLEGLDLAARMIACSENALYMQIHDCVVSEVQNFVRRVDWSGGLPSPDSSMDRFVRVVRQFTINDIGPYLFNIGILFPILQRNGWRQLGQFQNVTGALNLVTEFWQTQGDGTLASMLKGAQGSPSTALEVVKTLPASEIRETFKAASYSCKR